MSHRKKHRDAALMRRVLAKRPIKSDLTPKGLAQWMIALGKINASA